MAACLGIRGSRIGNSQLSALPRNALDSLTAITGEIPARRFKSSCLDQVV